MTPEISEFTSRIISKVGDQLESLAYYSHPFTKGGLVVVPNDEVKFIPDLIYQVYQCQPPAMTLNYLRADELFLLSVPGTFGWPYPLEERPHLAFWLKNNGTILHGRDIRKEIDIEVDKAAMLPIHIQRVKHCIRNWAFDQLWMKKYQLLIREIERQTRYLMATALLAQGEWELETADIPKRFDDVFQQDGANRIWLELSVLAGDEAEFEEEAARRRALESLWLFEQFMLQLRTIQ